MKLSALTEDNTVVVDGEVRRVDLSAYAKEGIHAVQWNGKEGHVEFNDGRMNVPLKELGRFSSIATAHRSAMPEADRHRKIFLEQRIAEEKEFERLSDDADHHRARRAALEAELGDLHARNGKAQRAKG